MNIVKDLSLEDFKFRYKINTRFRDVDAFKHINNAVFLSYFEDARRSFFERWNINLKEKSLIVASVKIDYLIQLSHPSELVIGQKVSRLGSKSFDVLSVLFLNNTQVCYATTTIVCYNFIANKTIPVFEEIKKDFNI
jgi:acyl-CoA thioester hydrolase